MGKRKNNKNNYKKSKRRYKKRQLNNRITREVEKFNLICASFFNLKKMNELVSEGINWNPGVILVIINILFVIIIVHYLINELNN